MVFLYVSRIILIKPNNLNSMQNTQPASLKPLIIICALFFIFGFVTWANGTLIPFFKLSFGLTDIQAFLVTFSSYMAYFFLALPSSWILKKTGFKNGIIMDGDLVFDVRFIPNPFYIPELKHISGENEETKDYVFKWPQTNTFIDKTIDMLDFLIPFYVTEGKTQLVIGIGCTGGYHRSVAIANKIAEILIANGHRTIVNHRDINKHIQGV